MSDIRYDRLHDTHVIIAPERLHRSDHTAGMRENKKTETKCPFCKENESMTPPEIFAIRKKGSAANQKGWKTRVVPNLYKAVQIEAPHVHHHSTFEYWEGFGAHEVIIDTPEHHTSMIQWDKNTVINWLKTLRARVADLRHDHRIAYISLFKNEGKGAGATQMHSHTQLIGLPFIPRAEREKYEKSHAYYTHHTEALMESMIREEEKDGERIIVSKGDFTAFCPYASAYPFEVIISSKKSLGQIDTLSDESIGDLAPLLLDTLKKMDKQLGCFDFNLSLSTPPLQEGSVGNDLLDNVDNVCRFTIRIMPRIYHYGGFEANTGIMINPVLPELAAGLLRESEDA